MPVKEAKLLEGKVLAAKIQERMKAEIDEILLKRKEKIKLAALYAGKNPSSEWYIGQQEKLAAMLGIRFERIVILRPKAEESKTEILRGVYTEPSAQDDGILQDILIKKIEQLNRDPDCHGIFIAMPLPSGFDSDKALLTMDARKDVEGIHPVSLGLIVLRKSKLIPPTAFAALQLIESTGISLRGKKAVLVGQSAIVGRPLNLLLGERRVTTTVCNTGTSNADLQKAVSESDIVVACAGQPGIVKGNWIKEGAVVIDVGTTEVNGKLVGDVEFEEAKKRAGFITPVPGGVGPLTVTMLMRNLVTAYEWQTSLKS